LPTTGLVEYTTTGVTDAAAVAEGELLGEVELEGLTLDPDADREAEADAFDADAEALGDALAVARRATTVTLSPGVPRSWAS
jgi:hypothetical protein